MIALDKKNWQDVVGSETGRTNLLGYSFGGRSWRQKASGHEWPRFVRAYDLETGKELWRCGGQTERPCASPVAGDGMVFVGSGYRGAFLGAFKLDGSGDIGG